MFCSNCGAKLADGSSFCPNCGTPVKQNTPNSNVYSQNSANNNAPVYSYNHHAGYSYNSAPQHANVPDPQHNPVLGILKKIGSSPLFIVCASLFTLSLLLSFWYAVGGQNQLINSIYRIADQLGVSYYLWSYFEQIRFAINGYAVVALIPSILVAVGLWLTFASAHNKYQPSVKTAGLTIIKVINCINLVWSCIVLAAVEIVGIIALIAVSAASDNSYDSYYGYYSHSNAYALGFVVGLMLTFAVAFAFEIIFLAKINKTINSMKNAAVNGYVKSLASSYVAVILIISAVFSLIGAVAALYDPFVALQAVVACAMNICFAVLIFSYNGQMRQFYNKQQNTYVYASQTYNQYEQNPVQPAYNNPVQTAPVTPSPAPQNVPVQQSTQSTQTADAAQNPSQEPQNDGGNETSAE